MGVPKEGHNFTDKLRCRQLCGTAPLRLFRMRCAAESRRLVESNAANVGRKVDIDKIDNCSEVTLGLSATILVTLTVWVFALPFFDIAGMSWMKSWERGSSGRITLTEFKRRMAPTYPNPLDAFEAMDINRDGKVYEPEFLPVIKKFQPSINKTTDGTYAFRGLDEDDSGFLVAREFMDALSRPEFYYSTTTTSTTVKEIPMYHPIVEPKPALPPPPPPVHPRDVVVLRAPAPQPVQKPAGPFVAMQQFMDRMGPAGHGLASEAFRLVDLDQDGFAAHGEFLKGANQLPQPLWEGEAQGVFDHLDINHDLVVAQEEFYAAFLRRAYLSGKEQQHTAVPPPSPAKQAALDAIKAPVPPITLQEFTSRMGAVTPETAFQALDSDKDAEISEQEMIDGGKAFAPPLTEAQAKYSHRGLDVNQDNKVVPLELIDTLKFGHFFPSIAQAQAAHNA